METRPRIPAFCDSGARPSGVCGVANRSHRTAEVNGIGDLAISQAAFVAWFPLVEVRARQRFLRTAKKGKGLCPERRIEFPATRLQGDKAQELTLSQAYHRCEGAGRVVSSVGGSYP